MPTPHKRFIEQTDAEWEATRRALLAPGILYWILIPIMLIASTVRVIIGLVGPEAAGWQDWAALALLIVLWSLFTRAVWQRRALWQRGNNHEEEIEPQRAQRAQRKRKGG